MIKYYNHTVVVFLLLSFGILELGSCTENESQTNNNVTVKCIQSEREALVSFRAGVNNIPGKLSSWVGEDCCQWKGVECDNESGYVIKLNLSNPAGRRRHYEYDGSDDNLPYTVPTFGKGISPPAPPNPSTHIPMEGLSRQSKTTSSLIHFKYLNYSV